MENKYLYKYKKYKTKYFLLKNQLAGGIDDFSELFNTFFGNKWILTGSEAIKLYLEFFDKRRFLTFIPNDVDIILIEKEMLNRKSIGHYIRVQTQPERSLSFALITNPSNKFDVTIQSSAYYYEVRGIRLLDPKVMLENYKEHRKDDLVKIKALEEIIKLIDRLPIKKMEIERKRAYSENEGEEGKEGKGEGKEEGEGEGKINSRLTF